ncbi:MAG: HAD-IA family hydrolase [Spirochaetia bacterium]|jgi:putative hydrolase of the HAD superfamily|nr:HAD-IA family hydrolase [Spirochaetia bacterium]
MTQALIIDLDDTLYSETTGLELRVLEKINEYVSAFMGWPLEETNQKRREKARRFGTTLEWLVFEEGLKDVDGYFNHIHPEEEARCFSPDPVLKNLLDSLDYPKIILTNAPMEHALRVLKALDIESCFSGIFDIRYNGLVGKPHPKSYLRVLDAAGFRLESTVFIDDSPKYAQGYKALGGRAILKDELNRFADLEFERIRSLYELPDIL